MVNVGNDNTIWRFAHLGFDYAQSTGMMGFRWLSVVEARQNTGINTMSRFLDSLFPIKWFIIYTLKTEVDARLSLYLFSHGLTQMRADKLIASAIIGWLLVNFGNEPAFKSGLFIKQTEKAICLICVV
ncbi:MAG: hypothetical protein Q8R54_05660 [Methylobacter sp.]|nr:hypothetical protein [Methylobacter sp.]